MTASHPTFIRMFWSRKQSLHSSISFCSTIPFYTPPTAYHWSPHPALLHPSLHLWEDQHNPLSSTINSAGLSILTHPESYYGAEYTNTTHSFIIQSWVYWHNLSLIVGLSILTQPTYSYYRLSTLIRSISCDLACRVRLFWISVYMVTLSTQSEYTILSKAYLNNCLKDKHVDTLSRYFTFSINQNCKQITENKIFTSLFG